MKVLTVLVPTYNVEKYLRRCLDSLLLPEVLEEIEVLVVNDGSKDQTWNILCELAKKDDCFLGISQSRNRGHQNAV